MSTLRFGILGCGGYVRRHTSQLAELPETRIVALCDVSEEITRRYQQENLPEDVPEVRHYTDPATMYAECELDAVVIATPHTLHFEHAMQALEAGCHVLVEKPMVTQADHAYALAAKADATGRILVIGYNSPCSPRLHWLREQIRQETFGKLEMVHGYLSQNWLELTTGLWRQVPALSGGGQAYDSGAHLFCSLIWSVESQPASVFAFIDQHGTPVDINSAISIRFASGVLANITISGNCTATGSFATFIFEKARVDIDGWSAKWLKLYTDSSQEVPVEIPGNSSSPVINFVDAIQGRTEPCTDPQHGIYHTELMDAIYESARTGQPARPKQQTPTTA